MTNLYLYEASLQGDRKLNEDYYTFSESGNALMAVVADGLGGHDGGELASRFICEGLTQGFKGVNISLRDARGDLYQIKNILHTWIMDAVTIMQNEIRSMRGSEDARTTLCAVIVDDGAWYSIHIGDSRIYHFTSSGDIWRTRDHSVTQMLLDEGEITEDQMGTHPDQNKLFKSLSMDGDDDCTIAIHEGLKQDDVLLLCTDGFWERFGREEIPSIIKSIQSNDSLKSACNVAVARSAGKSDNVTAILIRKGSSILSLL